MCFTADDIAAVHGELAAAFHVHTATALASVR